MCDTLIHSRNEISIETDIDIIRAIDISYTGRMVAESMLPANWQLINSHNRILCISFGATNPEILLNYTGRIKIHGATFYSSQNQQVGVSIKVEDIDSWESATMKADLSSDNWGSLGQTHERLIKGVIKTSITRNNLTAESGIFFFKDGSPFQGDYHQHGDGQAMSGKSHSEDSVEIYRKDSFGKILDLRSGVSPRHIMTIAKNIKKEDIPEPVSPRQFKVATSSQEGHSAESGHSGSGGGAGGGGY